MRIPTSATSMTTLFGLGSLCTLWATPALSKEPKPEELEVQVEDPRQPGKHLTRASHTTQHHQWERHHAQSAPEALARTPGVYVQKTAHAQASPYIRGLTGQRTVILFDGIRLNTSTYRQGPNQYFFTVDHQSIESLEVLRGSASTLYGSDALGGAIVSQPRRVQAPTKHKAWWYRGTLIGNTHSADNRLGGRLNAQTGWGSKIGILAGVGYQDVGRLQTSGPVYSIADNLPHKSPSFEKDQRTQIGTGYKEHTRDFRLRYQPTSRTKVVAALYQYRQRDAPRTDKCPPLEGRAGECLTYKKQDRDLWYLGGDHEPSRGIWSHLSARLSLSRQYEWRQWSIDNLIPNLPGGTEHDTIDTVHTYGGVIRLRSNQVSLPYGWALHLHCGADAYYDTVSSQSEQRFTDTTPVTIIEHSRGQYLSGSTYLSAGAFAQTELQYKTNLWMELGVRSAWIRAHVPADLESDTKAVSTRHFPVGGHFGLHWRLLPGLRWQNNIDHGFRAPNLDDLSGRQQVGPGFQFENHDLAPEKSWSFDSGLRYLHRDLDLSFFGFHTRIMDAIVRAPRTLDECPKTQMGPQGCLASRTRFSLINLEGPAELWGLETNLGYRITNQLELSAALSYAYGSGPSPRPILRSADEQVPLSRVPPLNGHIAWTHWLTTRHAGKLRWGGAIHWAAAQTRLALSDQADARIPAGGTPGFVVAHLTLGWRPIPWTELSLMLENLLDRPYRHHGSSVNGAGRSLRARIRVDFGSQ